MDWQIDCAAQICSALIPALSGVQKLKLDFDGPIIPTEWGNGEIDGTTWQRTSQVVHWGERSPYLRAALAGAFSCAARGRSWVRPGIATWSAGNPVLSEGGPSVWLVHPYSSSGWSPSTLEVCLLPESPCRTWLIREFACDLGTIASQEKPVNTSPYHTLKPSRSCRRSEQLPTEVP